MFHGVAAVFSELPVGPEFPVGKMRRGLGPFPSTSRKACFLGEVGLLCVANPKRGLLGRAPAEGGSRSPAQRGPTAGSVTGLWRGARCPRRDKSGKCRQHEDRRDYPLAAGVRGQGGSSSAPASCQVPPCGRRCAWAQQLSPQQDTQGKA